jgi:hypothetical protein
MRPRLDLAATSFFVFSPGRYIHGAGYGGFAVMRAAMTAAHANL